MLKIHNAVMIIDGKNRCNTQKADNKTYKYVQKLHAAKNVFEWQRFHSNMTFWLRTVFLYDYVYCH